MYKDKQFRVRKMEEIMADLQEAHDAYAAYVQKVFLADGDALIMKTEDLLTILAAVKELFPRVTRVAAYGTAQDILLSLIHILSDESRYVFIVNDKKIDVSYTKNKQGHVN